MDSLVYHSGALGDFITTLPAVSRFKAGRRLILLGRPEHGALASLLFDEVWDAGSSALAALFSTGPRSHLAGRFRGIGAALLFARADSPLLSALAELGVPEIIRHDPFPDSPVPVVDYHLSLFPGPFRGEERIPRLGLPLPPDESRNGVAIAFGSGSPRKNWPRERFQQVARRLAERGETVTWIMGPAEEGESPAGEGSVLRNRALPELAADLSRRRLFVGNDSGVAHLAAAVGCRVVALFGASDHRVWSPRGPHTVVIVSRSHDMLGIGTRDVLTACVKLLEKT